MGGKPRGQRRREARRRGFVAYAREDFMQGAAGKPASQRRVRFRMTKGDADGTLRLLGERGAQAREGFRVAHDRSRKAGRRN